MLGEPGREDGRVLIIGKRLDVDALRYERQPDEQEPGDAAHPLNRNGFVALMATPRGRLCASRWRGRDEKRRPP